MALTLADRFPARGTDPVTVIADADADSPEVVGLVDSVADPARRRRHRHPAGRAARRHRRRRHARRHVAGRDASALVPSSAATQPAFDIEVGGIAAELIDIKARLGERLPLAALLVVIADARAAVPHDRLGHRADQGRRS